MADDAETPIRRIQRWADEMFLEHPERAGETYFHHMKVSLGICGTLLKLAYAAFVHALFPKKHQRTVSRGVMDLYSKMLRR